MIGIVIATHASMASGIMDAIELITGKQENVEVLGLYYGDGAEEFQTKVQNALNKVNDGDGVIGFVDILGGTPSNTMLKCMREQKFPCITGVNMPMVLTAVTSRSNYSSEDLGNYCIEMAKSSISALQTLIEDTIEEEEEF